MKNTIKLLILLLKGLVIMLFKKVYFLTVFKIDKVSLFLINSGNSFPSFGAAFAIVS